MEILDKAIKISKDGRCAFNAEDHSYTVDGVKRIGVTTFISQYKEEFDSKEQACKYAGKWGLNPEEVLAEWQAKGLKSSADGTNVHKVFEDYIETGAISCNTAKEACAVKFIVDKFRTGKLEPVEAECLVYGNHVASMIDCVAKTPEGKYYILDWKTSAEIGTYGFKKYMKPPFERYQDCKHVHYSLQLSIYKQLYREHEISGCFIVKIGETDYEIIKADYIPTPNHLL